MSKKIIIAKIRSDPTVVEALTRGRERPFPIRPLKPMTEAEIAAAEELRKAKRVPRTKTFHRALGLTQE